MNHNITSTGNGDFQVESPTVIPVPEPIEKKVFDTAVDDQVRYNFKQYGESFRVNSSPYAQTTQGSLSKVEPFWNHAVLFETRIAAVMRLCYEASCTEINRSEFHYRIKDEMSQGLKHLIDILLAHHNNVAEVKKLLLSAYVAGTTSERMYAGVSNVNLARQLIAHSINTQQHQGPMFFSLFRRLSEELDFSLMWLAFEHQRRLED